MIAAAIVAAVLAADDAPFGADKALHFSASFGIAAAAYTGAALLHEPVEGRLAAGIGVGLAAGIAKELWDVQGNGSFSALDLLWDAAGVLVGTVVVWLIDRIFFERPSPPPSPLRGEREL